MNFCVLVKISKYKISLWYQSGTSPYEQLFIKDSNEIPLYFYVNGTDFIFGEGLAVERYNSNDPNAFGNYFDIIKDPSNHFNIAGNKKPVKQLLYHGIEKYLNFFITQVLYKNDSLESYRQNFPLRFWFEQDIEEKEKSLIENLFTEAGYDNIEQINYNQCLFEVLSKNKVINSDSSILILNGISNTLYMELYKSSKDFSNTFSKLDGLGADPSVKILAEMILEDILAQESYLTLDKEKEVNSLLTYAAEKLENVTPIIKGEAKLSDGKKHYFEVKQRVINDRLLYNSTDSILYASINDLLSTNNIILQNLIILLGTKDINTNYLTNKLLFKYPNVRGVEKNQSIEALKLVFYKIAKSGYLKKENMSFKDEIEIKNPQKISGNDSPPTRIIIPPIQKSEIVPPAKLTPPPIPTGLKPQLPPSAKLPNTPPVRLTQTPIPTGAKPQLPPSVKQPLMPPIKAEPPQMPNGLKPPVVSSKSLGPPPVPINLQPPPVPKVLKLPPPPPPKTPKIKSKKK